MSYAFLIIIMTRHVCMVVPIVVVAAIFVPTNVSGWEHVIYVSSSSGVDNSSCLEGNLQKPCRTLSQAVEGIEQNSTVIYLYPGVHELYNSAQVTGKSDVAIIGLHDENDTALLVCGAHGRLVFSSSINVTLQALAIRDCHDVVISQSAIQCQLSKVIMLNCRDIHLNDIVINDSDSTSIATDAEQVCADDNFNTMGCPFLEIEYVNNRNASVSGEPFFISAFVYDCALTKYNWKNDLTACLVHSEASFNTTSYQQCTNMQANTNLGLAAQYPVLLFHNFTLENDSGEPVMLTIKTQGPLIQQLSTNISLTLISCLWPFNITSELQCSFVFQAWFVCSNSMTSETVYGNCFKDSDYIKPSNETEIGNCISEDSNGNYFLGFSPTFYDCGGCPYFISNCTDIRPFNDSDISSIPFCADGRGKRLCGACDSGYGVPINQLNRCVHCDEQAAYGFIIFILIQLIPTTIMVFVIVLFSINFMDGFLSGLVFYCQISSVVYPGLTFNMFISFCGTTDNPESGCIYHQYYYTTLPGSIFNWNFIPFLFGYPLCIAPDMTPLEAITFWYLIPSYPLLLALVIFLWIQMYNKGYKAIVEITRPFHRLLARFWRSNNIEPSLLQSLASLYLLSFTQYVATSFQILHPTKWHMWNDTDDSGIAFFNDGSLDYFGWPHGAYGVLAILVLLFVVLLPMLFIQFYPSRHFQRLLTAIHLRKALLVSLGDVFTGPFKSRSDESYEYRYFAGFYLLLRIILLALHFMPYNYGPGILFAQEGIFLAFSGMIMIFRPFQKILHNFSNFFIIVFLAVMNIFMLYVRTIVTQITLTVFNGLIFGIAIFIYVIYPLYKNISVCAIGWKTSTSRRKSSPDVEMKEPSNNITPAINHHDDDFDFFADRITNPSDYEEQHTKFAPHDLAASNTGTSNSTSSTSDGRESSKLMGAFKRLSNPFLPD